MQLLDLFLCFLKIGAFSIGGGYAALPVIQMEVVTKYHWLTDREFSDLITISQMTPGPIAINAATFVGTKIDGVTGAIIATVGYILPSFFIVLGLSALYYKYKELAYVDGVLRCLRPGVMALILVSGISLTLLSVFGNQSIAITNVNILSTVLFAVGLFVMRWFKVDAIWMIIICGGVYSLIHWIGLLAG